MLSRRICLEHSATVAALLAASGLFPHLAWAREAAAFGARTLPEAFKALGLSAPVESREVTLTAPDIHENGAAVPLGLATTLTGARQLLLLIEKNPDVLVAQYHLSDAVEASVQMRAKMAESSAVYAVAVTQDGKAFFARKDVRVTLGGCTA